MTALAARRSEVPWLLLLGVLATAGVLAGEVVVLSRGETPRPARTSAPRPTIVAAADRWVPPAPERYAEIDARPLFAPTRRPPPVASAPVAAPATLPLPKIAVTGVVIAKGERLAFVRHGTPPKVERIAEGEWIEGWQLEQVAADRVVLKAGGTTAELLVGKAPQTGPGRPQPAATAVGDPL